MHRYVVALERDRPLFDEFISICEREALAFAKEFDVNLAAEPILVTSDDISSVPVDACGIVGLGMVDVAEWAMSDGPPVAMLLPFDWIAEEYDDDGDWLEFLPRYYWLIDRYSTWREELPKALRAVLRGALLRGFHSVFLSYGTPDEAAAERLASTLEAEGVTVWRFSRDALPGQKLHRMMHDGVASHDRTILLCSKSSLSRSGVLNEIERALEREAREGGSEVIIPISLDGYVFANWAPQRPDLAAQIRSRVIARYEEVLSGEGLKRLMRALRRL